VAKRIGFDELARGVVKDESRTALLDIIGRYPVDGVILGCTELPMVLEQEHCPMPLLNTLELHAEAALDLALS
jgi:aspartate racemase